MNRPTILQLLMIFTNFIYASDQDRSITSLLVHMVKTAPENQWGKNILGQSESYKDIKKEALSKNPTNTTYDISWILINRKTLIEKGITYIHRYKTDFRDKNIALLTTNIWISGSENITQFESRYGITNKHNDNEMAHDFKASFIDDYTTCYYWNTKPDARRYTLLTYIPFAQFVKKMKPKNNTNVYVKKMG